MAEYSKKQPKIVGYMAGLYDLMSNEAAEVKAEDGDSLLVWQGRLIETCTSIGIPQGYYKKVVDALRMMGCIEMLSRGRRGSALTAIALRHPPSAEAYDDAIVKSGWEGLTRNPSPDMLAAQLKSVHENIGGINIRGVFKNHEDRVVALETAVEDLREQVTQLVNNNKANNTQ